MGKLENLEKRFWSKVDRGKKAECWEWTGSIRKKMGYGVFWMTSDNNRHAHRVCWELVNGPIPDGKLVLHHCDNRRCVNPTHLFLGTQSDNVNDRVKKGRSACGEGHGMSKLTENDVRELRRRFGSTTLVSLAKEFGISVTHVCNIVHRKNWTHV